MRKMIRLFSSTVLTVGISITVAITSANAGEKRFFSGMVGNWYGPGEIVAGKYKGTKFTCNLNGVTAGNDIGMDIDGFCRIGVFSQPMSATIHKSGANYSGRFLDGQKGEGMDVTGGRFSTSRFVVGLKREKLDATMVARLEGSRKLNVTISVKVQGRLIPVIGMALDKSIRTSQLNQ
ncbi:MAG: hypothetical protein GY742_10900 [Hyphomicrobiales bacterium]|nr:hypothetical protein [Hyphomicrobiales bacterium]